MTDNNSQHTDLCSTQTTALLNGKVKMSVSGNGSPSTNYKIKELDGKVLEQWTFAFIMRKGSV
jgi:hypothetical protein